MTEKPGKRLVSKGQYFKTLGEKGATYTAGIFLGMMGIPLLLISLFSFYRCFSSGDFSEGFLFIGVVSLFWSLGIFCGCKSFFKSAQEIEPVAPITRYNTGDLPAVETLVRASDLSPSHQQAELLRAARQEAQTPPEQLLRATQEKRQDV